MKKKVGVLVAFVLIFVLGSVLGYAATIKLRSPQTISNTKNEEINKYTVFLEEVYSTIQNNYWRKMTDEQLGQLFVLGTEKITGQPQNVKTQNKENVFKMLNEIVNTYESDDKRKQFVTTLADVVLSNLEPFGRSRLYSQKEEKALSDNVQNKTGTDQYGALGIDKNASASAIKEAYKKESDKWNPETNNSPEAKEKFEAVQKAYKVLSDPADKKNYDVAGIEPTMEYKLLDSNIFYVHLTKFSPTSFEELQRVTEKVNNYPNNLNTLIFDLRDNVGGAIDSLPYFLGPFLGNDQYAYQFLHQDEKTDYKTRIGWMPSLVRYKRVVVLINENSQSTAELMASVLKKYNVGVIVGVPTRGWGTVEKVFPLSKQIDSKEEFSIFLVHTLTLREDGQPIEGRGVEPKIDVRDKNWTDQLMAYFNDQALVNSVKELFNNK
jgi:hypothetical protein